ncbi:MAG: hypothetical protein GF311_16835 [Candidatus Lokiarchaeota archaeon]|nr:hypothetical protein [Candidatus Lokiarchaeota archaeon]
MNKIDASASYKVNQFLSVRLEEGITNIYVGGKFFNKCKYLLMTIPYDEIPKYDDIGSIDEMEEYLDHGLETQFERREITPSEEFWGHCSNLQAWAEHNYDTRLLHSNLSFPLLKELANAGDPKAREVFKDEIARRIEEGNEKIIIFLINGRYLNYLTDEERRYIYEINQEKLNRIALQLFKNSSTIASLYNLVAKLSFPRELCEILPEEPAELQDVSIYRLLGLLYIKKRSGCDDNIFALLQKWQKLLLSKLVSAFRTLFEKFSLVDDFLFVQQYELTLLLLSTYFPYKKITLEFRTLIEIMKSYYNRKGTSEYTIHGCREGGFFSYRVYKNERDLKLCYFDTREFYTYTEFIENDFIDLSYEFFNDYKKLIRFIFLPSDKKDSIGFPQEATIKYLDCSSITLDKKFKKMLMKFNSVCRTMGDKRKRFNKCIRTFHKYLGSLSEKDPRTLLFSIFSILDVFLRNTYNFRYLDFVEFHETLQDYYRNKGRKINYRIGLLGFQFVTIHRLGQEEDPEFFFGNRAAASHKHAREDFFKVLSHIFFPEGDEKIIAVNIVKDNIRFNTRRTN